MKEITEFEKDLASIRSMMERSVKFISLSGLSGVMAGLYALAGAFVGYYLIYNPYAPDPDMIFKLESTAVAVLVLSLGTGCLMSFRKAKKLGVPIWNATSRQLLFDLAIPLVTGGLFIIILLYYQYYFLLVPASLLFYGLALINGSRNTYEEVKFLGLTEILLGLTSALMPGNGLIFWAVGFGIMHVLYGAIMHYRYDR